MHLRIIVGSWTLERYPDGRVELRNNANGMTVRDFPGAPPHSSDPRDHEFTHLCLVIDQYRKNQR